MNLQFKWKKTIKQGNKNPLVTSKIIPTVSSLDDNESSINSYGSTNSVLSVQQPNLSPNAINNLENNTSYKNINMSSSKLLEFKNAWSHSPGLNKYSNNDYAK